MGDKTIMVVDDEPHIRSTLERLLTKENYDVILCESAEKALKLLKTHDASVLLSDYVMPDINGLELIKMVREEYPDMVRIMLTGRAELKAVLSAINEGRVFGFLLKPWDNTELKVTIKMALLHRELMLENKRLLETVRKQEESLRTLERSYPGITRIERDNNGTIIIEQETA